MNECEGPKKKSIHQTEGNDFVVSAYAACQKGFRYPQMAMKTQGAGFGVAEVAEDKEPIRGRNAAVIADLADLAGGTVLLTHPAANPVGLGGENGGKEEEGHGCLDYSAEMATMGGNDLDERACAFGGMGYLVVAFWLVQVVWALSKENLV